MSPEPETLIHISVATDSHVDPKQKWDNEARCIHATSSANVKMAVKNWK